jgi:hypothetical protein
MNANKNAPYGGDANTEKLYDALFASQSLEGHEAHLGRFLIEQLARYEREPERGEEIAYYMAGLMSTPAVMNLHRDDPYLEVLQLAGELELPPGQRAGATWEEFASLVNALPK